MTANTVPTVEELGGVKQDTVQWPAKAHRVTQTDSDGDEITDRNPLNVTLPDQIKDIDDNGIAKSQNLPTIIPLNYGFDTTADYWSRFLVETDNDDIPAGQTTQLVIPLNYYWEAKSNAWKRWQGESGAMWTTVVGLYTPTFDPITDDTADAMKCMPVDDTGAYLEVATAAKQLADDHNVTVSNMIPAVETGLATSALQLADGHNVTVDNAVGADAVNIQDGGNTITVDALNLDIRDLTSTSDDVSVTTVKPDGTNTMPSLDVVGRAGFVKLTNGTDEACIHDTMLCTSSAGSLIGEGIIPKHKSWFKIGYNPVVTNVEETVWSQGGEYAFSKGEAQLEVKGNDNTEDIGTQIHTGTSTGGTTTTLIDTGADFTAGTAVALYDTVVLDKSGTTPEFGIVTGITATTLTITNGFSEGGTGDARDYIVLDWNAHSGGQAVMIKYLDGEYVLHTEIVILNGTTVVPTVNTDYFRVNQMTLIAAGITGKLLDYVDLRDLADTPVYAHISAGYTLARQAVFTVPAGRTLYINAMNAAYGDSNDSKIQGARVILRANIDRLNAFNTGFIFNPFVEVMVFNQDVAIQNDIPFKIPEKTDVIVAVIGDDAAGTGPCTCVLRGWVVS